MINCLLFLYKLWFCFFLTRCCNFLFWASHFTLPRVFSSPNSHLYQKKKSPNSHPTKTKQTNTLSQFSLCRSHTLNRSSSTKCQLGSSTENDRSLSQIPIPTFENIIFGFDRRYCSVLLRGRPETETSSLIIVWDFC